MDTGTAGEDGRRRLAIVIGGAVLALLVGWMLFVAVPAGNGARLLGVLLAITLGALGARIGSRIAASRYPGYDVAAVSVEGPITRDGGGGRLPTGPGGASADDIVEAIESADADENIQGLLVELDTPGGQVVPSEDIRLAADRFEGPTVAYATDTCASGGYWIASGCDEFHAREESIVGSIGVNGTQLGRTELAEKAGLDYRRFVAGEYKDTPAVWRDLSADERAYFQGLLDDWYDAFVDTVVEGRDLDPEFVRDTEARVYIGTEAAENGLVDTVGPREEMEDRLAERAGIDELVVEEFEPQQGIQDRVGAGARSVARAFGAGVAGAFDGDEVPVIVER